MVSSASRWGFLDRLAFHLSHQVQMALMAIRRPGWTRPAAPWSSVAPLTLPTCWSLASWRRLEYSKIVWESQLVWLLTGVLPLQAQCARADASCRSEGCEDPTCWQRPGGRPSGRGGRERASLGLGQQWSWATWPGWHQMQAGSHSSTWHRGGRRHHCDGGSWSTPHSPPHQPRKGPCKWRKLRRPMWERRNEVEGCGV